MSEGISAPALVYCNCTKEKEISDAAEENFEIYQYLTVDPDGDRNIFCTDYPFIFDEDCKPYINIKPFPFCRSRFYEEAVKNLEEYASRKCIEAENEGNTTEAVVWGQRASEFHNICLNVQQQKMLSEKQYPCLLQVLDRWFNSTKATVTEYFNWSKETWQNLERIQKTFMQVIQKARKKLKDGQPGFIETAWERFNRAFEAIKPDFDNIIIDEFSDSFYFDLEQIKREWHAAWNEKTEDPLSGFDRKTKSMSKIIELLSDMVCDELFFADHQELVSKNMERVRDIFQDFYEAVSELDYDDDLDFRAILEQFKTDLNGLQFKVEFRDTQKDFISKNSFLVCRCGGIIRVVYSGQDMDRGFYKLESNVVKFLQWIERDFHTLITETTLWDYWRVGVSFVDAYNFVRFILLSSGNASQFDTYYQAIYRGRVMRGYGVEMNITIKSASSKNKEEHNKSALLNLISASVGTVTFDMSAGIQIVASTAMVLMDPNDDNIESLKLASLGASSDEVVGFISKLGSAFLILKGFKGALSDFFYQSNADYVGNIKIDMHLGSHDITYERDYNVMGEEVTKEPSKSMEIRTRSYMYVEPTGRIPTAPQDIKIGKMIDIRYYKNTIRIDTTLAVDPDKIEGGKKEYKLNENGIYED